MSKDNELNTLQFQEDMANLKEYQKEKDKREIDERFFKYINNTDFQKYLLKKLDKDLDLRKDFANVMKDFYISQGKKK